MTTTTALLSWHCVYGGYMATGHVVEYLVTRDSIGWLALRRPATSGPQDPYTPVPFGRHASRRKAQAAAEMFERKSR